jgi:hypothetical protein
LPDKFNGTCLTGEGMGQRLGFYVAIGNDQEGIKDKNQNIRKDLNVKLSLCLTKHNTMKTSCA